MTVDTHTHTYPFTWSVWHFAILQLFKRTPQITHSITEYTKSFRSDACFSVRSTGFFMCFLNTLTHNYYRISYIHWRNICVVCAWRPINFTFNSRTHAQRPNFPNDCIQWSTHHRNATFDKKNINKYTNTTQQYTRYKTPRRPYLYLCMRCDAPIIGSNYADRSMNLLAPISAITYNHAINYTIHGQWPRMDLNWIVCVCVSPMCMGALKLELCSQNCTTTKLLRTIQ